MTCLSFSSATHPEERCAATAHCKPAGSGGGCWPCRRHGSSAWQRERLRLEASCNRMWPGAGQEEGADFLPPARPQWAGLSLMTRARLVSEGQGHVCVLNSAGPRVRSAVPGSPLRSAFGDRKPASHHRPLTTLQPKKTVIRPIVLRAVALSPDKTVLECHGPCAFLIFKYCKQTLSGL